MVTADGGEVGKVSDDRGLLAAEGQVDEILQLKKLQLVGRCLKLCGLAGVSPLGAAPRCYQTRYPIAT